MSVWYRSLLILVWLFVETLFVASPQPAGAQNVPQIGGMIGAMMDAAIAEQNRADWMRLPRREQACLAVGLRQANLNLQQVIASGISPNDGRISGLRETCAALEGRKLRVNVPCPIQAGGTTIQSRCDEAYVSEEDRTQKLSDEDLYEAAFSRQGLQTALIERPDAQHRREQLIAAGGTVTAVPLPNFDCDRAKKDDEIAICNSASLSALDGEYGTLFRRADVGTKNSPARKLAFKFYQDREKCGSDEECIRKNLQNSIASMAKILRRRGEVVETSIERAQKLAAQQAASAAEENERRVQEEKQEAARSAAARAEAEKQAAKAAELPGLIDQGNSLVKEASDFLKFDRNNPQLLAIAESIATLNAVLSTKDHDKIVDATAALQRQLHENSKYDEYVKQKADAQAQENARLLADTLVQVRKQKRFLESYIAQNPTSPAAAKAIELVRGAERALESKDLGVLQRQVFAVEGLLKSFSLENSYLLSLNAVDDVEHPGDLAKGETTGLAKTAKNRFLLEGAPDDLLLMYVSAPAAPHVLKNLRGDIVFDGGAASVCIFDTDPPSDLRDRVSKAMDRYGLRSLQISARPCSTESLLTYDVIAVVRGEYLKQELAYAAALTKEIEIDHVKPLLLVSGHQNEQELQSIEAKRKQLESDIQHGSFGGYALVLLPASQGVICGALKEDMDAHVALLGTIVDPQVARLRQSLRLDHDSFDSVYADVQRSKCSAVYGTGTDLKALLEALRRDQVMYQVFETSFSKDDVSRESAKIATAQAQAEKDATERSRAAEEARKLANIRARDRASTLAARQSELRQQYGNLADTSASDISREVKAYLVAKGEPEADEPGHGVANEFPAIAAWYKSALRDHWSLDTVNSELLDYGQVDWKGRPLQAVFSTIRIKLKNAIVGDYREGCFAVGHVIDHEFKVTRDAAAIPCDDQDALSAWKSGHGFQSLWTLN